MFNLRGGDGIHTKPSCRGNQSPISCRGTWGVCRSFCMHAGCLQTKTLLYFWSGISIEFGLERGLREVTSNGLSHATVKKGAATSWSFFFIRSSSSLTFNKCRRNYHGLGRGARIHDACFRVDDMESGGIRDVTGDQCCEGRKKWMV